VLLLPVLALAACSNGSATGTGRPPGRHLAVRSRSFPGPFLPQQIVSTGGSLWVLGTMGSTDPNRCAVERLDPETLRGPTYPLPECGPYLAAGDSHLYVVAVRYVAGSNGEDLHLETVDTTTGQTTLDPSVITTVVGSGLAHMAFAYGLGSLWLDSWNDQLWRISASTGAVTGSVSERSVTSGGHPSIVATRSGVWLAEGPGGGPTLKRLVPGSKAPSTVFVAPGSASILWLAATPGRVWADVATYADEGRTVRTRLLAFGSSGRMVLETPPEGLGSSLVAGSGHTLWTVGAGTTCAGPQRLWRVDGTTGRSVAVTTLRSPIEPCLTEGGSQLAVAGGFVFVLDATGAASPAGVLYRIRP